MQEYTIDRWEGEIAVLEDRESKEMINVPKEKIENDAREGDILLLQGNTYIVDKEKTEEARKRISNLLNKLKKKE